MHRLVTYKGLEKLLRYKIESLRINKKYIYNENEIAFHTLDGSLEFSIHLGVKDNFRDSLIKDNDKDVKLYINVIGDEHCNINISCIKYYINIVYPNEYDEDDYECFLPEYAIKYKELNNIEHCDWFHYEFADLSENNINNILQEINKIQRLKQCGCGYPTITHNILCEECQITYEERDILEACHFCNEIIYHNHDIITSCCNKSIHRLCLPKILKWNNRCCWCRKIMEK